MATHVQKSLLEWLPPIAAADKRKHKTLTVPNSIYALPCGCGRVRIYAAAGSTLAPSGMTKVWELYRKHKKADWIHVQCGGVVHVPECLLAVPSEPAAPAAELEFAWAAD